MTRSLALDLDTLADCLNKLLPVFYAGSRERLGEFIALYLEQSYAYLERANRAIETSDIQGVRSAVHAWRPAMVMLGLDELYKLAHAIEERIDKGDMAASELATMVNLLADEAAANAALIRSIRHELKP